MNHNPEEQFTYLSDVGSQEIPNKVGDTFPNRKKETAAW
jgi:hypothetical protein